MEIKTKRLVFLFILRWILYGLYTLSYLMLFHGEQSIAVGYI